MAELAVQLLGLGKNLPVPTLLPHRTAAPNLAACPDPERIKETYISADTGMLQHRPKLWRPRTHPGIKLTRIIRLYAVDSQPSIQAWRERIPRNDRNNAISLKLPDKRPRNSCKPARRVLGLAFSVLVLTGTAST